MFLHNRYFIVRADSAVGDLDSQNRDERHKRRAKLNLFHELIQKKSVTILENNFL